MPTSISVKAALRAESPLHEHLRGGMDAFLNKDVKLIAESERPKIKESLDLDAACKAEFPESNRWDYIISISEPAEIVGIEPHTAKDSEVSVVIEKKKHATTYLRNHFHDGKRVTKWFWVSHSAVGFSKMDRARRRLDQNGIKFAGRVLRSFA